MGKNPSANAGDLRDRGSIPLRRAWQPTPVFLPGKLDGQRSLLGYSPYRVAKSQARLKQLSTHACPG